ncbi:MULTISPECIES: hypothetical protein [Rhodococcus erythropolis group]|uniref:hypothetical protein n=1 Tax=Rhodococcus erythropolis group TaxID=2840174 RepID=UPI001BEBBF16|nr:MULTISPECIES: hypothetical protein [Rhodococcus erythropolis group]MBT2269663.1 hypothetical protein [Rhodococcus erythropolis]MBT2274180.1 hypothetical protein [Rhodococcus qingshengii]
MDRYKITMPDGAWTDEDFESDTDAIGRAIDVNHGVSDGIVVQRYVEDGTLLPTLLGPAHPTYAHYKSDTA